MPRDRRRNRIQIGERLLQKALRANLDCRAMNVAIGRHHDNRDARKFRILLLQLSKLEAIHLRHHQIEQNQIGKLRCRLQKAERFVPVG